MTTPARITTDSYLYYGNLLPEEPQHRVPRFVGLALAPKYDKDVAHNAYERLPLPDGCIGKIQSQDVFEHLEYGRLPAVLDEIHRVLAPGGIFRLSLPDYNSPTLRKRSVYNERAEVIGDTMMGARLDYDRERGGVKVSFSDDGNAHLWFPTYALVSSLILETRLRCCAEIVFHHFYRNPDDYVCRPFPENEMPVHRSPPRDMRAGGKPISLVVDFIR